MRLVSSVLVLASLAFSVGCSATGEDTDSASAEISTVVHEPQGDERKAIYNAFREKLTVDLNGQQVVFNKNSPAAPGRYLAHGDWAYFEGILEGPNGNAQPIDYANSVYAKDFADHLLGGVQVGGNFAAKFAGLAHKEGNTWKISSEKFGNEEFPTFRLGSQWSVWQSWVSVPPPGSRDIFESYPVDDLHAPAGAERAALLAAMTNVIKPQLNGQAHAFNATDPAGTFLVHDGWAYFDGIVEGPNGNTTAINYQNTAFAQQSTTSAFKGVLRNGNFAAVFRAILKKNADGTWQVNPTNNADFQLKGYAIGETTWVGDPTSDWSWDIFGGKGNGNGEGDGDGDGDGDGEGEGEGG